LGGGKWETNSNRSAGTPSINNAITIAVAPSTISATIVIDALTSGIFPGSMTISNLLVERGGGIMHPSTTLFLNNAGSLTSLFIENALTITTGGSVLITNSVLRVNGPGIFDDGVVLLNSGTILAGPAYIGHSGQGTLTVSNGTFTINNVYLGYASGANGTLTVANGTVQQVQNIYVGFLSGSAGTVWMTGGSWSAGGTTMYLGASGRGQMTVSNGTWNATQVNVGDSGNGTLTLAGGMTTVSGQFLPFTIGNALGSTGTLWITGGQLDVTNAGSQFRIGAGGVGTVTMSNGMWQTLSLEVGNQGTLNVTGGTLVPGQLSIAGSTNGPSGTMWMSGGSLLGGAFIGIASQMTISNGMWTGENAQVNEYGTLRVAGGINVLGSLETINAGVDPLATGSVWMTEGQLVTTGAVSYVGENGAGFMAISNGTWHAGEVDVGFSGTVMDPDTGLSPASALTVAGGTHTFTSLQLGVQSGIPGALWMSGGELTVTNAASVIGSNGIGQITISNGTWLARDVFVGSFVGGQGALTVAGGATSVSHSLLVGSRSCTSSGAVVVTGGSLLVTNAAHNAVLDLESGRLTLSGGTLVVDTLVKTNPCASFHQTGGTLVVGGVTNLLTNTFFRVTAINREGNNIRVTWQTSGGETNMLQATNGGPGGSYKTNFVDLPPQIIVTGVGLTTTNALDVGGATNFPSRFYRVRLVP